MEMSLNVRTIDLEQLRQNVRLIRSAVPDSAMLLAVVKADAYGHGAVQVARTALEAGASFLAVAQPWEGVQLREAGILAPILVLGAALPADGKTAIQYDLTLTVSSAEAVRSLAAAVNGTGCVSVHLKLDTGMCRIGARTEAEVQDVLHALAASPQVRMTGVFTHFADADGNDVTFTQKQLERFRALCSLLPDDIVRHCANSAAIHRLMPEAAFDMVRMGISMYGYPPVETNLPVKPFLTWRTHVTHVKDIQAGDTVSYGRTFRAEHPMRIATLACGYGDGYHRASSDQAEVLIHGRRVRVIGRICMDQMMADVTDVDNVRPGDTATLLGTDGEATITAEDIARWAGTISYEVLLAATGRVHRVWLHG